MTDRLTALRLFSRVARLGSFSRAARESALSQPSVSRIIAELERDVGAGLLTRTTRAVVLTEAGQDYLARIEPILAALDEADHAARGTGELRGTLRVAASSSFTMRAVVPALPDFLARHPALRIEMTIDDLRQDLLADGIDVALRFGRLPDSTATARYLATLRRVLVAAPTYLERAGTPGSPADLPGHRIILGPATTGAAARGQVSWTFERDGRQLSVRLDGHLGFTLHEAATAAAVAGLGIFAAGSFGCRTEIEDGRLHRLLTDWSMDAVEIHAVFPAGRAAKPAARAFADHLKATLDAVPDGFWT